MPAYVRDGMKGPPKDPQSYKAWERNIEDDRDRLLKATRVSPKEKK